MRTRAILLLLFAIAALTALQAPYANANDACEQIVEAFAARDFALLIPVLFDLDDDAVFDSLFRAGEGMTEDDITEYTVCRSDLEEDYERNLMSLQRQFKVALAAGDSLGVDWARVQYDGYMVYDEDKWLGYANFYDFEILLKQDGATYWLNPGALRQTPRGWKLAAGIGCRFNIR